MNKKKWPLKLLPALLAPVLMTACSGPQEPGIEIPPTTPYANHSKTSNDPDCPGVVGWSEGLAGYLTAEATMPTAFAADAVDCAFNEWSWETFVWATALINGTPRFMQLKTPDQLFATEPATSGLLRLSSRAHGSEKPEGAGAFVEADGSMLVGPNGFPVYASIHMNDSYFNTVKANLISTGDYQSNAGSDSYFETGAAVFKATWYRLADGETAPDGAYTTQAEVPKLTYCCATKGDSIPVVTSGEFETVTVALVGLHVVGLVDHHPEFLWATFEHDKNAPMIEDNTFTFDASKSDPNNYTFYKANTPYSTEALLVANQPNTASDPALLTFDESTGTFSPVTQIVQMNKTGGDNQPNGPANIAILNQQSQGFLANLSSTKPDPQSTFKNYNLIGTLWMQPDTYVTTTPNWQQLGQANGVGAIKLANSTAETFMQSDKTVTQPDNLGNCFECHNPQSFSYSDSGNGAGPLAKRRIALSHVVAEGSAYAVPNMMPVIPPWKKSGEQ